MDKIYQLWRQKIEDRRQRRNRNAIHSYHLTHMFRFLIFANRVCKSAKEYHGKRATIISGFMNHKTRNAEDPEIFYTLYMFYMAKDCSHAGLQLDPKSSW